MRGSRHRESWFERLVYLRLTLPNGRRRDRIKILLIGVSYGASLTDLRTKFVSMLSAEAEESLYRPRPSPARLTE